MKHNKVLLEPEMQQPEHAKKMFHFSRKSDEAKRYAALNKEFLDHVNVVRKQAMVAKRNLKQQKVQRLILLIDECRQHGGPVTKDNILLIDRLDLLQLQREVKMLKVNGYTSLRLRKRSDRNPVTGKFTMSSLDEEQLRRDIRAVLTPHQSAKIDFASIKSTIKFD